MGSTLQQGRIETIKLTRAARSMQPKIGTRKGLLWKQLAWSWLHHPLTTDGSVQIWLLAPIRLTCEQGLFFNPTSQCYITMVGWCLLETLGTVNPNSSNDDYWKVSKDEDKWSISQDEYCCSWLTSHVTVSDGGKKQRSRWKRWPP